jgi:nucleoside-diphosphate-sugar epimerase
MPHKILITGASGFVGCFLLERLLITVKDDVQIIALHSRELDPSLANRFSGRVSWLRLDITRANMAAVTSDVDAVYHLAAYSTIHESEDERRRLDLVNVQGTARLLEACKAAGVTHFVFVSSVAACESGPAELIDEENGLPVSTYGKTKKAAEKLVLDSADDTFKVTVLRPTALFGEDHLGSIYELTMAIDRGRFVIFGDGANNTNFYYVRDFVELLVMVLHNPAAFGKIFIASDTPCTLENLANYISAELGGVRVPKIPEFLGVGIAISCDVLSKAFGMKLPLSYRRYRAMTMNRIYSNRKMIEVIGLPPKYGVQTGIKNTIEYFRRAGLLREIRNVCSAGN